MNIDLNTILSATQLLGLIVIGFMYLRRPQEKTEVTDAVFREQISTMKADFANLRDNHLHTIESKLDTFISNQEIKNTSFSEGITRITTILEERLPKKK